MISEWELWVCAQAMIGRHGEAAARQAQGKADDLAERAEPEGAATWRLIVRRIHELQRLRSDSVQ